MFVEIWVIFSWFSSFRKCFGGWWIMIRHAASLHLNTLKSPSFSSTLQKKLASIFFKDHFPGCKTPSFFTTNQKQPDPLNSLTAKNQVHHVADRWDFWRQQKWKMEKSHTFPQRLLRFKHKFKGGADFLLFDVNCQFVSFFKKSDKFMVHFCLNLWCRCDQHYLFGWSVHRISFFFSADENISINQPTCLPMFTQVQRSASWK